MQPVHHKGAGEQSTLPRGAGGLQAVPLLRGGPEQSQERAMQDNR